MEVKDRTVHKEMDEKEKEEEVKDKLGKRKK